jgi:hypothetical protein
MSNIWIFGCSFSSGYLDVPPTDSYGGLLSKELGLNLNNVSRPGNDNDKIFYDLASNLDKIEENDIIVYQFSSFNRMGFFDEEYFSSAGIPELGTLHKHKEAAFSKYKIEELDALLAFILTWQEKRHKFLLNNAINTLKYLEKTKNTRNIILFLTNECVYLGEEVIALPLENKQDNFSLNDYLDANKLTIGHEYPEKYIYGDTHPGFKGHIKIKELILNKL